MGNAGLLSRNPRRAGVKPSASPIAPARVVPGELANHHPMGMVDPPPGHWTLGWGSNHPNIVLPTPLAWGRDFFAGSVRTRCMGARTAVAQHAMPPKRAVRPNLWRRRASMTERGAGHHARSGRRCVWWAFCLGTCAPSRDTGPSCLRGGAGAERRTGGHLRREAGGQPPAGARTIPAAVLVGRCPRRRKSLYSRTICTGHTGWRDRRAPIASGAPPWRLLRRRRVDRL